MTAQGEWQRAPGAGGSRLDSAIAYFKALTQVLDQAAAAASGLEGPILVIGLGNGRSLDHLREKLPGRRFLAYDLEDRAHPRSRPDSRDLFLQSAGSGIEDVLGAPDAPPALIHCDFRHALDFAAGGFSFQRLAEALCPGGQLSLEWPEASAPRFPPVLVPARHNNQDREDGLFLLSRSDRP